MRYRSMKRLSALFTGLFIAVFSLSAQEGYVPYIPAEELPNLVNCLPAPPDTGSVTFAHDIVRYMWGKEQRHNPERLAIAYRDAIWSIDTTLAIFSKPFGLEISKEKTPEIYELMTRGMTTVQQICVRPKAHYFRMRPFARFHEPSILPEDDSWLATEGSYPSGHTVRGWTTALLLAEINPAAAEALFARAWEYGESRVIAGCHWQSDVDASRPASSIGYAILQTCPAFRAQMARAQAEFRRKTRR